MVLTARLRCTQFRPANHTIRRTLVAGAATMFVHCAAFANGIVSIEWIPGTCLDFNQYVGKVGARPDDFTNRTPGLAGATKHDVSYDGKYFAKPATGSTWCAKATLTGDKYPFTMQLSATVLGWSSPKGISQSCQAERNRYLDAIMAHENKHVRDLMNYMKEHERSWNPKPIEICAESQSAVELRIQKEIKAYLMPEAERMTAAITELGSRFDKSPAGAPIPPMNCALCN